MRRVRLVAGESRATKPVVRSQIAADQAGLAAQERLLGETKRPMDAPGRLVCRATRFDDRSAFPR